MHRLLKGRPLSPHLQIYRWELSMVLSILHRATGIVLSAGLIALTLWLLTVAGGPSEFAAFREVSGSALGRVMLLGWTFALFLHVGNGIRHLAWDVGLGFSLPAARVSGWMVVTFAVVATGFTWWCAQ